MVPPTGLVADEVAIRVVMVRVNASHRVHRLGEVAVLIVGVPRHIAGRIGLLDRGAVEIEEHRVSRAAGVGDRVAAGAAVTVGRLLGAAVERLTNQPAGSVVREIFLACRWDW